MFTPSEQRERLGAGYAEAQGTTAPRDPSPLLRAVLAYTACCANRENQEKGIFLGREAEELKWPLLANVALRCLVWCVAGCQASLTPLAGAFVH